MTRYRVNRIKEVYKQALISGKIVFVGGMSIFDVRSLVRKLTFQEWVQFEEKELLYRMSVASRKINHGDFICKGNLDLWIKVIKVLTGIFYKHQSFRFTRKPNDPCNFNFVKYCCRVVKSFPRRVLSHEC